MQAVRKPWEVVDEQILPFLTVHSVFGDLRGLRQDGRFWQARCPFHEGRGGEGAFSIDPERLEWNCFLGCGGGGPVQYLQKSRGLSWMDAASELAFIGGVEGGVLEPWREIWAERDFLLHEEMELRSSLLSTFMVYTQSVFESPAGDAIRRFLAQRRGFRREQMGRLGLGLYTAPEDVWQYLKGTARDLTEVRSRGLFEGEWAGRIVCAWKDLRGRTINIWGWRPDATHSRPTGSQGCLLFDSGDPLGGRTIPFNLDAAERTGKIDILLLEGPLTALLTLSLGLEKPFPVAVDGELNAAQVQTLQRYLQDRGSLTLCCSYDPETQGTPRDRTSRTLQALKQTNFPIYVVDSSLMADAPNPGRKVAIDEFILASGGGDKSLLAFRRLLEERQAEAVIPSPGHGHEWVGMVDFLRNFSFRGPKRQGEGASVNVRGTEMMEPLFRAAEEVGRRLATGFLKAMPSTLLQNWMGPSLQQPEQQPLEVSPDPPALPVPTPTLSSFSVERLEQESRTSLDCKVSPWEHLNSLGVRFSSGEVILLAGRTGHGKSAALLNLLVEWIDRAVAKEGDELFFFYSTGEPEIRIYHRLLALLTAREGSGWTVQQIEEFFGSQHAGPGLVHADVTYLNSARQRLRSWEESLHVAYQPACRLADLIRQCEELVNVQKVGAVMIDQLQVDEADPGTHNSPDSLKRLAVQLQCPVICAARIGAPIVRQAEAIPARDLRHPSVLKAIRQRRPRLQDLQTIPVERESDLVLGLLNYGADYRAAGEADFRETQQGAPFEFGTLKNRYGPAGRWAYLTFEEKFGLLRDNGDSTPFPGKRSRTRSRGRASSEESRELPLFTRRFTIT